MLYTKSMNPIRARLRTKTEPITLNQSDRKLFEALLKKNNAGTLSPSEKTQFLKLAAADFSKKFGPAMKKLASE